MTDIWCVTEGKTGKRMSEKQGHIRNTRHCSHRHWFVASFYEVACILEHGQCSVYDKAEGILSP